VVVGLRVPQRRQVKREPAGRVRVRVRVGTRVGARVKARVRVRGWSRVEG